MSAPQVSIVVIGRNEGERLRRCLQSIAAMEWDGVFETIYVDSQSSDGSAGLAAALGARVLVVTSPRPTAALARNLGWRSAMAPSILFVDGDTVLDAHFLGHALAALQSDPRIAIVWGHRREIGTGHSLFNRVLDLDWIYRPGLTDFCGGDALVRRSVLDEIGGYDQALIAGEEPEMCRRLRGRDYRILHIDRPMTGHDLAMTHWPQYWCRAVRAGYAYAQISELFKQTPDPFWQREARRNRVRAAVIALVPIVAGCGSALAHSWTPLGALMVVGFAVLVRTAAKTRWKSRSWTTLLLYGLHSHLQQIPIFAGQISFLIDRRKGRARELIEYKDRQV